YISLVILVLSLSLYTFVGFVMYAVYHKCDPVKSGRVRNHNQLMPLFVTDMLSSAPGAVGLLVACVASAALSTMSSIQNAMAAVWLEDFIRPIYRKIYNMEISDFKGKLVAQIIAIVFGILVIGVALSAEYLGSTLVTLQVRIGGIAGGPITGLF
ncbi:unnamed protein product, partial [Owenia fusiformis]